MTVMKHKKAALSLLFGLLAPLLTGCMINMGDLPPVPLTEEQQALCASLPYVTVNRRIGPAVSIDIVRKGPIVGEGCHAMYDVLGRGGLSECREVSVDTRVYKYVTSAATVRQADIPKEACRGHGLNWSRSVSACFKRTTLPKDAYRPARFIVEGRVDSFFPIGGQFERTTWTLIDKTDGTVLGKSHSYTRLKYPSSCRAPEGGHLSDLLAQVFHPPS